MGYSFVILLSQFGAISCFMSGSNCCFLTCIQVSQETDKMIWYFHLFKNFPQFVLIYTVKGFSLVNEAEVYIYIYIYIFKFSCFLCDPVNVGNLTWGWSSSNKSSSSFSFFRARAKVMGCGALGKKVTAWGEREVAFHPSQPPQSTGKWSRRGSP